MSKTNRTINVNIPFCGYYETIISSELEYKIECFLDEFKNPDTWMFDPLDYIENEKLKEKLQKFDRKEIYPVLCDRIWWYYTTADSSHEINKKWIDSFCDYIKSEYEIDLKPNLDTVSMSSPREYNFETDRLFCDVDFDAIKTLYLENKGTCDKYILKRMEARDGFIPWYSNHIEDWGDFTDWDYNQWGLILEALITDYMWDEIELEIQEYISSYIDTPLRCTFDELFTEILEILTE